MKIDIKTNVQKLDNKVGINYILKKVRYFWQIP